MNSSGFLKLFRAAIIFGGIGLLLPALPALADDDHHCCVDWSRLNLTSSQNTQVQQLEDEWARQYNEIRPVIVEDQQKLTKLLANHNSDPVEVMALQQAIARKGTVEWLCNHQLFEKASGVNRQSAVCFRATD